MRFAESCCVENQDGMELNMRYRRALKAGAAHAEEVARATEEVARSYPATAEQVGNIGCSLSFIGGVRTERT